MENLRTVEKIKEWAFVKTAAICLVLFSGISVFIFTMNDTLFVLNFADIVVLLLKYITLPLILLVQSFIVADKKIKDKISVAVFAVWSAYCAIVTAYMFIEYGGRDNSVYILFEVLPDIVMCACGVVCILSYTIELSKVFVCVFSGFAMVLSIVSSLLSFDKLFDSLALFSVLLTLIFQYVAISRKAAISLYSVLNAIILLLTVCFIILYIDEAVGIIERYDRNGHEFDNRFFEHLILEVYRLPMILSSAFFGIVVSGIMLKSAINYSPVNMLKKSKTVIISNLQQLYYDGYVTQEEYFGYLAKLQGNNG